MNRRQKIVLSVTGIFLVLLLLVGLTYAYFLTRITGNTNDKSISVSTANLAIVYGNDDGSVIGEGEKITPGTTFEPKRFIVTNQGNANTDYVVVIEDASVTYAETIEVDGVTQTAGTEATFESNDFTYTLTCESGCNSVQEPTTFPIEGGILVGNRLDVGETQTYLFTLTYNETGENQSNDMNKKLEGKINIIDITKDNPYKENTSSLAYNIINNAILGATGTTLVGTPETTPAVSISRSSEKTNGEYELAKNFPGWDDITYGSTQEEANTCEKTITEGTDLEKCNSIIGKYIYNDNLKLQFGQVMDCAEDGTPYLNAKDYEKVLSVTQDEYGTSYYYRGQVEDNYLEFNNMCWRIVRIEGDGSVKITLAAQKKCSQITSEDTGSAYIGTGDYGYTDEYYADYENSLNRTSSMKYKLEEWFNGMLEDERTPRFSEENLELLKTERICIGDTTNAYTKTGILMNETEKQNAINNYESFYYKNYIRMNVNNLATLMCDASENKTSESKIYPLTVDEVVFAGGKYATINMHYYLRDNATTERWWTLSPVGYDSENEEARVFFVNTNGRVNYAATSMDTYSIRPAVSLISGISIMNGNGTQTNPYAIS